MLEKICCEGLNANIAVATRIFALRGSRYIVTYFAAVEKKPHFFLPVEHDHSPTTFAAQR